MSAPQSFDVLRRAREPLPFRGRLRKVIVIFMVNLRQDAFVATGVLQSRAAGGAFVNRCPIAVVLLEAKALQYLVAEEILASVVGLKMGIRVVGMALHVQGSTRRPRRTLWNKFTGSPHDWTSRTNDMKPKEPIMGHAQAKGATLEEGTQPSLVLGLQVIPLESVFS